MKGGMAYGVHNEIRYTKGLARYTTNYTPPTEPFPHVWLKHLSGTVKGNFNAPLSRRVRSYRRSDGMLVDSTMSDATTGEFALSATDPSLHFVVVFDDENNAMVYDHIEPMAT